MCHEYNVYNERASIAIIPRATLASDMMLDPPRYVYIVIEPGNQSKSIPYIQSSSVPFFLNTRNFRLGILDLNKLMYDSARGDLKGD